MMGNLLGSLVWGAKSEQYCVIGGGSLQIVSEPPAPGHVVLEHSMTWP
jgi:hypothetical protein